MLASLKVSALYHFHPKIGLRTSYPYHCLQSYLLRPLHHQTESSFRWPSFGLSLAFKVTVSWLYCFLLLSNYRKVIQKRGHSHYLMHQKLQLSSYYLSSSCFYPPVAKGSPYYLVKVALFTSVCVFCFLVLKRLNRSK